MSWTKSTELILKNYYEISCGNVIAHEHTYLSFKKKGSCFSIPRIVLSGILGSGSLGLEYVKNDSHKSYALLFIGCLGLANSLLGAISGFLKYEEQSGVHYQLAQQWNGLARKIELQLKRPRHDRMNSDEFLEFAKQEFDKLAESSLPIPEQVILNFKKEYKNHNFAVPYYLNGMKEISIYRSEDDEEEQKKEVEVVELVENKEQLIKEISV